MNLAIISDLHADVHALRDALAQIERLGCDEVVCAGDVLDYGRFPERTIALLQERRIPTVRGNHDRWALSEGHDTTGWNLTPGALAFIESLPTSWTRRIDDVRVAVWHARTRSDVKGIYPDASTTELASQLDRAEADVLVVGHTHLPFARFVDRRLVCNPGALLRDPAEPMEGAMLFDRESGKLAPAPAPGGGTFAVLDAVHRAPGRRRGRDREGRRYRKPHPPRVSRSSPASRPAGA
jgi:putative phosphoesterase